MCGRFTLTSTPESLALRFELEAPAAFAPRYNIAPGQEVCVVRETTAGRALSRVRWGLVPAWAKDPSVGHRMINARAETLTSKPAFRDAVRRRRCLVPADGFYEWANWGGPKQAYHVGVEDGRPFGFAGLWERWLDAAGEPLETCTIVTTEAAPAIRDIHPRMPVILEPEAFSSWLDPALRDPASLLPWLRPLPDARLRFHPVGERVNHPHYDDPTCMEPVPEGPRQESLF